MHQVLEVLLSLALTVYYWLEAIVLFFVPVKMRAKSIAGQKVLVTGAGSGLGRGMSVGFAEQGCHLVLWDINASANEETAETCRNLGAKVHTYTCDLSKREAIYQVADKVKQEVGDIDILVNNAGIVTGRKLLDCPDPLMEATMNVNCNAHFWTLKSFLPSMLARNHGHIVSIASMAGIGGVNGLIDYCASKFGAVGLHEALHAELDALGKTGVKTTVVCPGYIDTGMFSGVYIKWEFMAPLLKPDYAVNKIMEAILINQELLIMPRTLYAFAFMKTLLPVKAMVMISRMSGISSSMDNFRGRAKSE